ncbi:hypothetical protein EJB05_08687 [Eragrostis curvula]|uniref:Secreted protein n=1 Tax=Eragrostis curvula TaxID=38414 RepID=A0A5J9W2W3_9POAL|nr:hypothetical protein EJB05_08687 [Eragrostis curvula]
MCVRASSRFLTTLASVLLWMLFSFGQIGDRSNAALVTQVEYCREKHGRREVESHRLSTLLRFLGIADKAKGYGGCVSVRLSARER